MRSVDRLAAWFASGLERFYVVYTMFSLSFAGFRPIANSSAFSADAQSPGDPTLPLLYAIMGLLIAFRFNAFVRVALTQRWILLLVAFAIVSATWSQSPPDTIHGGVTLVATCAFGWYLVVRWEAREILVMTVVALTVAAALSLFWGIVDPAAITIPIEAPAWRGVYETKNVLGRAMVLDSVLLMLLLIDQERRRWMLWSAIALSIGMIIMSESKTALMVFLTLVLLIRFSNTLRLRITLLIPILLAGAVGVIAGVLWLQAYGAAIARGLGKDATMTGRTLLWAEALKMIERHPFLGYGYAAFWRGFVGDSGEFWNAVGWPTPHSHNGFLDLTLDLGVIGLVVLLIGLGVAFKGAILRARIERTAISLAPLLILSFTIYYNLTESSLVRPNTIFWVLCVVAMSLASGGVVRAR